MAIEKNQKYNSEDMAKRSTYPKGQFVVQQLR